VWDRAPKTGLAIAQKCLFRTYFLGIAALLPVFPTFLATGGSHDQNLIEQLFLVQKLP
jgi:hypothetical protein